ncbi:MAG TPA: alpha-1,2-fucosyltransferase [Mucilaginibacter sp.]|jgi:hypothetical protein|nr:alpha-1,2-fucosyltransferase [Mucilaginibacter sp.]
MIIIHVKGGLGNQLFQYSLGRHLAIKNNCELFLDLSFYDNGNQHRNFLLNDFNTKFKILPKESSARYKKFNNADINRYYNYFKFSFRVYSERHVEKFKPKLLTKKNGFFEGYWQSEKYFNSVRSLLLSDLTLKFADNKLRGILDDISSNEAVSLHVRKSDYLNPQNKKIYSDCDLSYYQNAVELIKIRHPKAKFYIFSDDFDWVSKNLPFNCEHLIVNLNNTPVEDIYLMSRCKHNIIANSTFSWWGAWLNNHPDKIVIAPEKWFVDEQKFKNDILPDNWTKIANSPTWCNQF